MELSKLAVVQHHGLLTLTLDFQGEMLTWFDMEQKVYKWTGSSKPCFDIEFSSQILKKLYLRNGRVD